MKNLTDVLQEIQYEYNLGYESYYEEAIIRTIEILKSRELDETWSEEEAARQRLKRENNEN